MVNKFAKFYSKNKKNIFILFLAFTFIFAVSIYKTQNNQNYWQCRDGHWVKKGNPKTNPPSINCLLPNSKSNTPIFVVESFYDWFLQSNKTHVVYNNVKDTNYFTSDFKKQIDSKPFNQEGSPFYCKYSDNLGSFNAYLIYEKNNKAIVSVYQNYIDHQEKIDFVLIKTAGVWKIDKVECTDLLGVTKKLSQSYN